VAVQKVLSAGLVFSKKPVSSRFLVAQNPPHGGGQAWVFILPIPSLMEQRKISTKRCHHSLPTPLGQSSDGTWQRECWAERKQSANPPARTTSVGNSSGSKPPRPSRLSTKPSLLLSIRRNKSCSGCRSPSPGFNKQPSVWL